MAEDRPDSRGQGPLRLHDRAADKSEAALRSIIEEAATVQGKKDGTDLQKVGDLYQSFMDTERIQALGIEPVRGDLDRIAGLQDKQQLPELFAELMRTGTPTPFIFFVGQDAKQADRYIAYANQGGLGLPDRDFYLLGGDSFVETRAAYRTYLETLLRLAGDADAKAHAQQVYALETEARACAVVARGQPGRHQDLQPHDPARADETRAGRGLGGVTSSAAGIPSIDRLSSDAAELRRARWPQLETTPMSTWKLYLRVRLLDANAQVLPKAFRDAEFALPRQGSARPAAGQAALAARRRRRRRRARRGGRPGLRGAATSRRRAKARMQDLVANLLAAYGQSHRHPRLDDPGHQGGRRRRSSRSISVKIGYPDKWRDYSRLEVRHGDDAAATMTRAGASSTSASSRKLGKPVDRTEWGMTPQTVNAYYNPALNEIVFPAAHPAAAVLRPERRRRRQLRRHRRRSSATRSATASTTRAAATTATASLRNWWTAPTAAPSTRCAAQLVEQFDAYEPVPGHEDQRRAHAGREHRRPVGGLEVAYKAYKLSLKGSQEPPVIDGFTGDQRFFLGWAQVWRTLTATMRCADLLTDPHSPGQYRVNGVVREHARVLRRVRREGGRRAYLPPEKRVKIW